MSGPLPNVRLRLKPGADPEGAVAELQDLMGQLRRLPGSVAGPTDRPAYLYRRRDDFLQWAEHAILMLSNHTELRVARSILDSPGYERVRAIDIHTARPVALINTEIEEQLDTLAATSNDLCRRIARVTAAPGRPAVLDTNSLLHYKLPSEIDWPTVFGYSEVRLVIPRAVIDELDRKKWEGADRIRKKARAVLPRLERLLAADGSPREILPGVTLEALVEPGPRERPEDADEAILAVCIELAQFSGAPQPVTLVTADTGLRIRATQEGITAVGLPDSARRDPG